MANRNHSICQFPRDLISCLFVLTSCTTRSLLPQAHRALFLLRSSHDKMAFLTRPLFFFRAVVHNTSHRRLVSSGLSPITAQVIVREHVAAYLCITQAFLTHHCLLSLSLSLFERSTNEAQSDCARERKKRRRNVPLPFMTHKQPQK